MLTALIYGVLFFVLLMLVIMTYQFNSIKKNNGDLKAPDEHDDRMSLSHGFIYTSIVLVIVLTLVFTWYLVKGTPREAHLMEWLNIIVRLMHITFGIAWIGASFYFVFLDN